MAQRPGSDYLSWARAPVPCSRPVMRPGILARLALSAAALAACGTPARAPVSAPEPTQAERVRADSLRRPYTEADIEFLSHMIVHHQQAVTIASWARSHDAGAEVRRLADRIASGQVDEIGLMRQWLADRGRRPHPAGHTMVMPGMLTETQLQALGRARGADFDRLFLTLMIQHHRGAVAMVRELFATPGAAQDEQVFKIANDVSVDQTTEIARMEKMLSTLTPETPTQ